MSKLKDQSETIVRFFEDRLGNDELLPLSKLVKVGVYGSLGAAKKALERGDLDFVKVSRNRTLVYRKSIIDHLKASMRTK